MKLLELLINCAAKLAISKDVYEKLQSIWSISFKLNSICFMFQLVFRRLIKYVISLIGCF